MESRYLYRGKRLNNGEWVEGAYYVEPYTDRCYIIQWNSTGLGFNEFIEVDRETICQCTGLKDDGGTPIFENDVLSLKDEIAVYEWKAVVKFGNPNAEHTWGWQLVPITECDVSKDTLLWVETEISYMYCEAIGNGFDNPELLEV